MKTFPFSHATSLRFTGALPAKADVVVIGGGIIGVSTALFLARAGQKVVLLEKGCIAGEQSSRNWGWIRQQGRDPDELPIMVEANRHWRALAQQTNQDIGLTEGGVTYLAETKSQLARYRDWTKHAVEQGVDTRVLTAAQVAQDFPGMSKSYVGALHTASDMRAEPWRAVPALAEIAVREGADIIENCAARCLDFAAGKITGVVTEKGTVSAPEVVLTGGAWSSLFLRNHDVMLPQLSVRATVAATTELPAVAMGGVADGNIAFRHRTDGGYTLAPGGFHELFLGWDAIRALPKFLTQLRADPFGTRFLPFAPTGYPDGWGTPRHWSPDTKSPFEHMRVLNPNPNMSRARRLKTDFAALFPYLPDFSLSHAWAGMIDTMPDVVPVVDRVAALPGLTLGTGMSGHGFGIGPAIGRILADLAMGNAPGHNLTRFRFARFSDGSKMNLGPAL